jgi:hypothetical protein
MCGFDESVYGFTIVAIHSPTNSRNPNFKSWVQGYLKDEPIVLVGHTNICGFF